MGAGSCGRVLDPASLLPNEEPSIFNFVDGYSKRTLLNGYLPIAHTGVWNPHSKAGYESIVVLTRGENPQHVALVRATLPEWLAKRMSGSPFVHQRPDGTYSFERYWKTPPEGFWEAVAGVANYWQHFFEDQMPVDYSRSMAAGFRSRRYHAIALQLPWTGADLSNWRRRLHQDSGTKPCVVSGCALRICLGPATVESHRPERSLFPALPRQLYPSQWRFPLQHAGSGGSAVNTGIFLWNSARAFDYTGDLAALRKRLPVLQRMLDYVLARYEYSKNMFPAGDRRRGLIWGSPEADLGAPANDFPNSHPLYYQNSIWTWRGLKEHARCLHKIGESAEAERCEKLATPRCGG